MELVTILVAVVCVLFVLCLPLWISPLIYIIVLFYYPDYLRFIVAGLTFPVSRVVILAVLLKFFLTKQKFIVFKWRFIDTIFVIGEIVFLISLTFTHRSFEEALKYRLGFVLDTTIPYFAFRNIYVQKNLFLHSLKWIGIILLPAALLGIYETTQNHSPYDGLLKYRFYSDRALAAKHFEDRVKGHGGEERFGLYRAQGPHGHPLVYGLSLTVFLPFLWRLRKFLYKKRGYAILFFCVILLGSMSSLSSGTLIGIIIVIAGLLVESLKKWFKAVLILLISAMVFLQFYSNRPFYHVFGEWLALDPWTAYARARLIDIAIERIGEYWLFGYGLVDPGWGREITGLDYTDVCVYYIYMAITYGVFAMGLYLWSMGLILYKLYKTSKLSDKLRSGIAWACFVSVLAILMAHFSVTPFGALIKVHFVVYALSVGIIYAEKNGKESPPITRYRCC
ncbi:MAG: hypothetical protein JXA82_01775 [Sedimentisphaerales bacterium]|nr:hypothetical protein [Sedimentisphaerales bacterium]